MSRTRLEAIPASVKKPRACCWCSSSESIDVSWPGCPGEQPETGDPGSCSDLDDVLRRGGRDDHGRLCADARCDRVDAQFERLLPRAGDDLALDDDSSANFQFESLSVTALPVVSGTRIRRAIAAFVQAFRVTLISCSD